MLVIVQHKAVGLPCLFKLKFRPRGPICLLTDGLQRKLHCHQERVRNIDVDNICREFLTKTAERMSTFGKF